MIAIVAIWLAGCVTTTTGPKKPQADRTAAAESNYNLGWQYYLREDYDKARTALNRSLEYDSRLAKAHMVLGLTYEKLDIPRLAKQHYELAVRSEPRNLDVRNAYAVYLCNNDQADAAREQFERVVGAPDNDDPEIALTNAGVCMQSASDAAAAETYFRRALDEKANHPEALFQLMLLKHGSGDSLSARAFLERYMSVVPPKPEILQLAMEIERKAGNDTAECEYMRRLLSEFPTSDQSQRALRFSADRCMR